MVGQVFNSKANLQHAAKLYSITAHQEYVVVESTTKLLVLRCKKAKQSQCPWKLRAMLVKCTTSFAINKYNGPHKCINPCLNRDHQQLDSNLIAAHIQGMIKAQFTLSVATIQARFKHCRPVLSIDGTHLYGKYKGTLMIAIGCDGNNRLFPLAFALTEDRHPGIMAAMSDVHLGWEQGANRLASNEEYTLYVDAKIKANVVKAGSHEIVLYDHIRGHFHVKTNKGTKSSSTRGRTYRINLQEYACTCDIEYRGHSSDPYPLDTSVLVLQDRHMSHLVDSGQLASVLTCRQHISRFMREWEMDSRLRPYIIRSGFYGLRIHGLPITGTCDIDWSLLCYELLGVTPLISEIKESAISTRWLCHQFSQPPVDLDDATLERYARAFILGLIGLALFTDKKGSCVERVWTVPPILLDVSHYYRLHVGRPDFGRPPAPPAAQHLEHDATDDLPAKQLDHGLWDEALLHEGLPADPLGCRWRVPLSWVQNPSCVLTFYRDQLDAQTHDQVLWESYMGDLVAHLSAISLAD
ncbi:Serine/threonine-protein phosphatase 7 long form-like [Vitis vinifera]|uniref:Serine/threonine-protein phosphatase 7 long form-like n=1 Tax=Vitis vinifera TaxID=29760 RepID=A0A438BMN4_VITVI|nr:Serine/threonine-protein phosphatase 7 long form-like [Vitis vinifera]